MEPKDLLLSYIKNLDSDGVMSLCKEFGLVDNVEDKNSPITFEDVLIKYCDKVEPAWSRGGEFIYFPKVVNINNDFGKYIQVLSRDYITLNYNSWFNYVDVEIACDEFLATYLYYKTPEKLELFLKSLL